jgi:hypothetical protein
MCIENDAAHRMRSRHIEFESIDRKAVPSRPDAVAA